jgi:hypothetical protein
LATLTPIERDCNAVTKFSRGEPFKSDQTSIRADNTASWNQQDVLRKNMILDGNGWQFLAKLKFHNTDVAYAASSVMAGLGVTRCIYGACRRCHLGSKITCTAGALVQRVVAVAAATAVAVGLGQQVAGNFQRRAVATALTSKWSRGENNYSIRAGNLRKMA